MGEVYKTYRNNSGEVLKIVYDSTPENPLEGADTLFTYSTWLSRYESLQPTEFSDAESFIDYYLGDGAFDRYRSQFLHEGKGIVQFADYLCELLNARKGILAFPILSQVHSNVHYYLGSSIDRWEGSIAGFAWVEKSKVYKEFTVSKISTKLLDRLKNGVSGDLNLYNKYANGEVYGYEFFNSTGDLADSCYGFYEWVDTTNSLLADIYEYLNTKDLSFVEVQS